MNSIYLQSFSDELQKIGFALPAPTALKGAIQGAAGAAKGLGKRGLEFVEHHENPIEVAGLGYLAAPSVDTMVAKRRARRAGLGDEDGHISEHDTDKYRLLKDKHHDLVEATGLGALAAPLVAKRLASGKWH